MKKLTMLILLFFTVVSYSQKEKKEIVHLLFDELSKETCKVPVEGKGYLNLNKFRKEVQGEYIYFKICDETFSTHKTKSFKDTCSIESLNKLKLVGLENLIEKYDAKYELKHHVFDKIFIIEKVSKEKFVKYEVTWIDEIIMVED